VDSRTRRCTDYRTPFGACAPTGRGGVALAARSTNSLPHRDDCLQRRLLGRAGHIYNSYVQQVRPDGWSSPEHLTACVRDPIWRSDIDSLSFSPHRHEGHCVVHRRAFWTLLGFNPTPEQCKAWFAEHDTTFQRAAEVKIARGRLPTNANLHLTSRDILRAMAICRG